MGMRGSSFGMPRACPARGRGRSPCSANETLCVFQQIVMHSRNVRPESGCSLGGNTGLTLLTPGLSRRLPLGRLTGMSALQIIALAICGAVALTGVALFARVVRHFLAVFRLGQPDT